jgi:hypothetical protein
MWTVSEYGSPPKLSLQNLWNGVVENGGYWPFASIYKIVSLTVMGLLSAIRWRGENW